MPGDSPDFIPYKADDAAPAFIPYQAPAAASAKQATSEPQMKVEAPAGKPDFEKPGVADAYQQRPNNPFSSYLSEAENLTEEGKKEHPIESGIGTVSKGVKGIGSIIGTMGGLFSGPEGMAMFGGAPEAEAPTAGPQKMLPAPKTALVTPPPEDASFVRGVPAETAVPVRKMLPPPKSAIITPPPPDASFVRGVPAGPAPEVAPEAPPAAGPARKMLPAPSKPAIITPPEDSSFVRGIPAEYPKSAEATTEAEAPPAGPAKSTSKQVDELMNTVFGQPLKPNVPLREQIPAAGPAPEAPSSLETKYPDKGVRQMVHANGEKIVDAIGDDKETMSAIHGLKASDLSNALLNSGEDMGQKVVSSSKFLGGDAISRQEAFNRLLAKGHTPQEIVKLATAPR